MASKARIKRFISTALMGTALFVAGMGAASAGSASDMIVVVPEGTAKPAALSGQVAHWRQQLGASNVVWVDSLKRDKPSGFASMAVLNFKEPRQLEAWNKSGAAVLPASLQVVAADVLARGGSVPTNAPMYKISYYKPTSSRKDIQAWVDGYLKKYLDAQVENDILTRYAMYLEEGKDGRLLLVLEYTDAAVEQHAEPIKAKLSEDIARVDAEYARQSDLKESLRVTQSWTLAVPTN
ncbi:hypothetical protein FQY83_16945 [Luteimonas marina]|uniref:Uncharacterized protein n=1 Tax=Luteimonas marina TaxID=488485 RepID=A0A5C5TV30_9GAMM|nr:hypothetical protein [Luteimonas marina]TWT17457.1 hypothetical protein FQY83_16945 [Luteimonas marina]